MIILEHATTGEWLEQRRHTTDGRMRVTATEAARLLHGGVGVWTQLAEDKQNPPKPVDSPYFAWGHKREPVIAQWARMWVDESLTPENRLYVSDSDERFAASPDMVGYKDDGVILAEIKTTTKPLSTIPPVYMGQMQWQMLVTGATKCWFIWELHHDFTVQGEPHAQLVEHDDKLQQQLVDVATSFLDGSPETREFDELLAQWKTLDVREAEVKALRETLRQQAKHLLGDKPGKWVGAHGSITYSETKPRERFDTTRFKHDHPQLAKDYTTAGKPSTVLRVSFPKAKKESNQ